jgi:transcriptional regulator with XRE-family HTH domain
VRSRRRAAGLSQEELAHESEVDRTDVSQVERRLRNLTISVLARIARALGTTPDQLLIPSGNLGGLGVSGAPERKRAALRHHWMFGLSGGLVIGP